MQTLTRICAILLAATSVHAINLVSIPYVGDDTNRAVWAPWWQSNSPWLTSTNVSFYTNTTSFWEQNDLRSVANWQCWEAVDWNFSQINTALSNSLFSSGKLLVWQTNSFTTPYLSTNLICTVSNFAGMSFAVAAGTPTVQYSIDGTNWGSSPGITTNRVSIRLCSQQTPSIGGIPAAPLITNVQIWGLSRPDLFGQTNALYGQALRVGPPLDPDDAVSMGWVTNLWGQTPWMNAQSDVQLNGYALHPDSAWVQSLDTNGLHWRYLGHDVFSALPSAPLYGAIAGIAIDSTGTNVVITVATNNAGEPRLQFTPAIFPATWTWLDAYSSSYPFSTNGLWTIRFPMPTSATGFMRVAYASQAPPVLSIAGVAMLTPRTITNATDTTWGAGMGLFCADSNYVYISVGSNRWKRATLSAW